MNGDIQGGAALVFTQLAERRRLVDMRAEFAREFATRWRDELLPIPWTVSGMI